MQWVKKSGPRFEIDGSFYEFHWYECVGVGRVELKQKQIVSIWLYNWNSQI